MSDPSTDRAAFLRAIETDPRDLTTRKVFADWLEENGDRPGDDDLAVMHRGWTLEKQDAWGRMESAANLAEVSVERLLDAGREAAEADGWMATLYLGFDTPDKFYDENFRRQFWADLELLTGCSMDDDRRGNFFVSCAC